MPAKNWFKYKTPTRGYAEYHTWSRMIGRCTNPNVERFPHYGGRGIKVCSRWMGSFPNFLFDMGKRPPGGSIERIDVNGNYEPGNCRWATMKEQTQNKQNTVRLKYDGKEVCMFEFSRLTGIPNSTLHNRMKKGILDPRKLALKKIPQSGEKSSAAKLTQRQADSIREQYKSGRSRADLARKYGVSWCCIRGIVKNQTYK